MSAETGTKSDATNVAQCGMCPLVLDRRMFLRDAALAAVATLAALGAVPGSAFAESVRNISPVAVAGGQRAYRLPAADSVAVDIANDVIIARWQDRVYAFSLRCPHRGARLEWHSNETRIFCPKHKARFRPDGAHDSGRTSRDLDRFDVGRQGEQIIVDFDALRRVDVDAAAWRSAMVQLA
jgi:nitrite reductase/ring-hydroxylating ferredoxin subunit